MKPLRQTLGWVLSILMALALFAPAYAEGTEEDWYGKYDPPITMNWANEIDDLDEQTISILNEKNGETLEKNRFTDLWLDRLGINIEYQWIAKGEQATQKFKMAMASGDLPDYFFASGVDLRELAENDMIEDMTGLYEQYASPLLKEMLEPGGLTMTLDTARVHGKLYGIPQIQPTPDSASYLWLRKDWLDHLGLDIPVTVDELYDIVVAFTENDPDGNGEKDTYGFALDSGIYWGFGEGLFWGCGAYPKKWVKTEDGSIVYGSIQETMIKPLQMLADMYKNGYIDREFGSKDFNKEAELINQGKVGAFYHKHWIPLNVAALITNVPEADLISVAIPGLTPDVPGLSVLDPALYGGVLVAKKGAANPEAIIKMANVWVDVLWGPNQQFDYYYNGDDGSGNTWRLSEIHVLSPNLNADAYIDAWAAVESGTVDQLTGSSKAYYENSLNSWAWMGMMRKQYGSFGVLAEIYLPENRFIGNAYVGAPTDTQVEKDSMLSDLESRMITQIILGELEVEAGFRQFVDEWLRLGGEQITAEINATIQ